MDIQKDYSCLERNTAVSERTVEAENDYQESLPAYCDDIYKVIKCAATHSISSADINYNEVVINGRCHIWLTYLNENGNLCFADFEESFTKTLSVDNLSDKAFVYAVINEKYVNYRVINQRRIDIHTAAVIDIRIFDTLKCPCILGCDEAKLKTETVHSADLIASNISSIEFDEDFMIPADSQPIKRIVSFSAFASVSDTKVIKDKALVKGLVNLSVMYTSDTAEEEVLKTEYSFNVSKIIDAGGIAENDIAVSDISVSNVYLKAKVSSGDKMNVISAFGEVSVNTVFIRETEQQLVCDGYVLGRKSSCSYSDYSCISDGSYETDHLTETVSVDLSADAQEVKEVNIALTTPKCRGNKLIAKVNVLTLCRNAEGELITVSGSADLTMPLKDRDEAIASLSLLSYDYRLAQNGQLELRLNIAACVFAYRTVNYKVLADIDADEAALHYPSLTVYFAKEKESLWSIAKQFSSDAALIARDNNISGETLDGNKVIIIQRA